MRLYNYLQEEQTLNESRIMSFLSDFKNKSEREIKRALKSAWESLVNSIRSEDKEDEALSIINKALGTNYNSLDKFSKVNEVTAEPEEKGFVNWLKSLLFQGRIGATIFTSLQIFFQLDELIDLNVPDPKRLIIYGFL